MKRLACACSLSVVVAGCLGPTAGPRTPDADGSVPSGLLVQVMENGAATVHRVALEDYVRGTVLGEFAPAAGDPVAVEKMMEVQAIVSRTYAAAHLKRHAREGFDLCATTHCQLFDPARLKTSRWSTAVERAVHRTSGQVLRFEGRLVEALFHADCGGHTSTAASVWGGDDRSYLISRADDGTAQGAHAAWEYRLTLSALAKALNTDSRTRIAGAIGNVEVVSRDGARRAKEVAIRGATVVVVRGEDFRQVLSRAFGARSIRSTLFDVTRDGSALTFAGRGFGHGVGMCQAGALARLTAGARPGDVLAYYYPGTSVSR
jgi:stage II sporulation protein D